MPDGCDAAGTVEPNGSDARLVHRYDNGSEWEIRTYMHVVIVM